MKSLSEWIGDQEFAKNPKPEITPVEKKWKATKDEIVKFWQNINPNLPIIMNPIDYEHKGTTYAEDGIRVTGSKEFIASVISRLKDFLQFENQGTKLQLAYRQTDSKKYQKENAFVLYIQTKQRGGSPQK